MRARSVAMDLDLCMMDIDTAFMYAPSKTTFSSDRHMVSVMGHPRYFTCNSVYTMEFNELLREWLLSHGWTRIESEMCIYIYTMVDTCGMLGLYIDDLSLACNNSQRVMEFKRTLGHKFENKYLGELSKFLGMHIVRDRTAMKVSIDQSRYITYVLDKYGISYCSSTSMLTYLGFLMHGIASIITIIIIIDHARDVNPCLFDSLYQLAP
jgi:hypothetical protein